MLLLSVNAFLVIVMIVLLSLLFRTPVKKSRVKQSLKKIKEHVIDEPVED